MQKKSKFLFKEGDKYGRLTLTGKTFKQQSSDGYFRTMVEAVCECGDVKGYQLKYLIRGDTKSCGCHRKDTLATIATKHHLSKHPLYSVYQDMIRRCYKSNCKSFPDYGGREIPITVCDEWKNDVKAFYDWGIANGWEKGLDLDRRENDGNYEPLNCRFVTRQVSNSNTRRNVIITAWGETKTATEWANDKRCNVNSRTLLGRFKKGRWKPEEAITTPSNGNKKAFSRIISTVRYITAWGETKGLMDWVEDERCNVGYSGLKIRLNKGWIPEDAISIKTQH